MKRQLIGALCALSLAAAPLGVCAETAAPKTMTLSQAMEYAAQNHPQVLSAEATVDQSETAVQEAEGARITAKRAVTNPSPAMTFASANYQNYYAMNGYGVETAQISLDMAENVLEQVRETVKLGVKSAYYQYATSVERVALYENDLAAAQERYQIAETKLAQGAISQLELETVGLSVETAQSNLAQSKRNVDINAMALKNAVGVPIDEALTVTGTLEVPAKPETKLEDAMKQAEENGMDVENARLQTKIEELNYRAVDGWYTDNTYAYKKAKYGYDAAAYQLRNTIETLKINVAKAYDTMAKAFDSLALAEKSADLNDKSYEIAKAQFELGMITANELEDAANEALDGKLAYADALYGALMGTAQYEFSYTVGNMAAR